MGAIAGAGKAVRSAKPDDAAAGSGVAPLVSIVIVVKNGMPRLAEVLDMVARQEFDGGYEVIVIDSGSTDGSREAVPVHDPRFRLVEIEPATFGHGKTRNLGASLARGRFCAFLTHDARPANAHWLSELVRPLIEDDQVAGVFGRHIAYDEASPFTAWELETHFEGLRKWPKVWITDAREYVRNQGIRQVYHFYSDNSSCMRKSVWERHPYPDVDFAEDQLWAKEIVEAGYRKAFAWDSVVYHSHDYSPWQRLQRSYDEARALNELFGYEMCSSRSGALKQTIRTSGRDLVLSWRNRWFWSAPVATLLRPFDNFARQVGYYLGTMRPQFTQRYALLLSRDRRLRAQ